MKTALRILLVVSMAALVAACGPRGFRKNNPVVQQNQSTSFQNEGSRHQGGKLRRVCAADIQKFCSGQNKVRKCLRNVSSHLQPDCNTALQQAIERRRDRRQQRQQMNNTNNTQSNPTQPQGQNQATPQNTQPKNSSSDDDDDDD
jgi:hypothetical protein